MASPVSYALDGEVAVITIDNPPVNALSHAVREGLLKSVERFQGDSKAKAAVIVGAGRTFIAGADITEIQHIENKEELISGMMEGMKGCGGCHKLGLKSEEQIARLNEIKAKRDNTAVQEALDAIVKTAGYVIVREETDSGKEILRVVLPESLKQQLETRHFQLRYIRPADPYEAIITNVEQYATESEHFAAAPLASSPDVRSESAHRWQRPR